LFPLQMGIGNLCILTGNLQRAVFNHSTSQNNI
jgi:hypothetical protein